MQTISETEKSVQELAAKAGWWNTWSVRLVAMTAIVAVAYFVFQWMANRRGNELSTAQAALIRDKDEQLARDLKAKDEKIALAEREAGKANKAAGEADERASKADERAALADERAGQANERAGQLEKEAAGVRLRQEELRQRNLATEAKLEQERFTRLELEKSLAPRLIPIRISDGKSNVDSLRSFAGTGVVLNSLRESESERAALNVLNAVQFADWKYLYGVAMPHLNRDFDGVVIEPYKAKSPSPQQRLEEQRSGAAANALFEFLKSEGWQVRLSPGTDGDLDPNSVKITVGQKPLPFFDNRAEIAKLLPKQRINGRRISEEQRSRIVEPLLEVRKSHPEETRSVEIKCPNQNREACNLAVTIGELLRDVGIPFTVTPARDFPRTLTGIHIIRSGRLSRALTEGFGSAGFEVTEEYDAAFSTPAVIKLSVGW